ncbi:hypothetical protein [Capybara microvirus Cap1_SP_93]|nr:hypothetical protein [Capybara microvirus Cap1_SP_93]
MISAILAAAIASAASAAVAGGSQAIAQSGSEDFQREMADKAYERQKELMYLQSQNNWYYAQEGAKLDDQYQRSLLKDSAQIEKQGLMNAGLSVGSMNGSFSPAQSIVKTAGSSSSSAPSVGMPQIGMQRGINLDNLGNIASLLADVDLKGSQKELIDAQAKGQELENNWINTINDRKVELMTSLEALQDSSTENNRATYDNIIQDTKNKVAQFDNITADSKLKAAQMFNQYTDSIVKYEQLSLNAQMTASQVQRLAYENKWTDQQIRESMQRISVMDSQIMEIGTRCDLNQQQMRYLSAMAFNVKTETDLNQWELKVKEGIGFNKMSEWKKRMMQEELDKIQSETYQNYSQVTKNYVNSVTDVVDSAVGVLGAVGKMGSPSAIAGFH